MEAASSAAAAVFVPDKVRSFTVWTSKKPHDRSILLCGFYIVHHILIKNLPSLHLHV